MATALNTLKDNKGARKVRTRVGRGIGSGKGKTCGRGMKGQKSRSGVAIKGFEGGQMPIYRRLPKRGFNNHSRVEFQAVNVAVLQDFVDRKKLDTSKPINNETLLEAGVVTHLNKPIKILAKGEVKAKLTLDVDAASKSAIAAIEKAGGKIAVKEKDSEPRGKSVKKDTSKKKTKAEKAKTQKSADSKSEAA